MQIIKTSSSYQEYVQTIHSFIFLRGAFFPLRKVYAFDSYIYIRGGQGRLQFDTVWLVIFCVIRINLRNKREIKKETKTRYLYDNREAPMRMPLPAPRSEQLTQPPLPLTEFPQQFPRTSSHQVRARVALSKGGGPFIFFGRIFLSQKNTSNRFGEENHKYRYF